MTVLTHVPATTSPPADLADHLRRDGYVIVDNLVPDSLMDTIGDELAPYLDATPMGYNAMIGRKTRRTGALIARSPGLPHADPESVHPRCVPGLPRPCQRISADAHPGDLDRAG